MALLIRNALLDGTGVDCLVEGGIFTAVGPSIDAPKDAEILDASGAFIVPPFYNCHTHAPMNLFRGMSDDLELFDWLQNHIWPAEAKLTASDIARGARQAIREMVRSGTVFFNDMYWHEEEVLAAAAEAGVRACIGPCLIDGPDGKLDKRHMETLRRVRRKMSSLPASVRRRLRFAYAPHAVYTVSESSLMEIAELAKDDQDAFIHVHASETAREVAECRKKYGITPIALLDRCGLLGPRTILAHCVHLDGADMELIAARGSTISSQPCSNFKLCSGIFDYAATVQRSHCKFTLGTDGAASNNSLSMFDDMKFAALGAKVASGDPTCARAEDIFAAATSAGARAFGFGNGKIAVGEPGDAILIDAAAPQMTPCFNLASNIVYSADPSCVLATVCDGRILFSASGQR